MNITILPALNPPTEEQHRFVVETYGMLSDCIAEIGNEMERLAACIATASDEQLVEIERQQAILADQYEAMIPHWRDLRWLKNTYELLGGLHGATQS